MTMTLGLEAGTLALTVGDGSNSMCVSAHDLGFALHREVMQDRSGSHGASDSTALSGARVMTFAVRSHPYVGIDMFTLAAFTRPGLRPIVTVTDDSLPYPLQATCRVSPFSDNAGVDDYIGGAREFVLQMIVASGRLESATEHSLTIYPGTPADGLVIPQDGLVIPEDGLVIPSAGQPGFGIVTNAGIAPTPAILRVFGPFGGTLADETVISNQTTGDSLVFVNLQVLAGEYLEIDLDSKRITLNGDESQSRRRFLDVSQSDWFLIEPGDNSVAFLPDTSAPPAQLEILWHDAW